MKSKSNSASLSTLRSLFKPLSNSKLCISTNTSPRTKQQLLPSHTPKMCSFKLNTRPTDDIQEEISFDIDQCNESFLSFQPKFKNSYEDLSKVIKSFIDVDKETQNRTEFYGKINNCISELRTQLVFVEQMEGKTEQYETSILKIEMQLDVYRRDL
ncbi:Hypothetical_protein [Hexamita inflata]|uniref:Hypothetical_protein n=1 Tax=Hexamita inflata TaxID=28002 RepID=A0AA86THT3_9EUKA|nr:Hypothetical protein HINF_LOCUS5655 [Hexamita inflata]